jgi:chromate transporter
LQLAAVAVIAQAALTMQRKLAPDRARFAIALAAVAVVLLVPTPSATVFAILLGAGTGLLLTNQPAPAATAGLLLPAISKRIGVAALLLFGVSLTASLLLPTAALTPEALFSSFFRAGSLVFGGGHVVLPLLNGLTVARGWISEERFLAGYGAAQALPGPLFAYSAFLGAAVQPNPRPIFYSLTSILAIFLPGMLLITGVLPFWSALRNEYWVRKSLQGINAAVVGVLIAALYSPIWTSSIHAPFDFLVALAAFVALVQWRIQPWIVVVAAGSIAGFQ